MGNPLPGRIRGSLTLPDGLKDGSEAAANWGAWVPTLNTYGGWYGRSALPGDVLAAFVGEELNPRNDRRWPPLYGGVTGMYLWRAMARVGVPLHACYFTNAIKVPGFQVNLKDELEGEVCPIHVVALGRVADNALQRAGVRHAAVPHPAYWKRFHASDRDGYVKKLKEALGA